MILTGKNCFYSIQCENGCLAASVLFHMFTQSSLYIPLSRFKDYRCLKNVIHHIGSKNEWLLLSESFAAKFEGGFCLNTGKDFFVEISF